MSNPHPPRPGSRQTCLGSTLFGVDSDIERITLSRPCVVVTYYRAHTHAAGALLPGAEPINMCVGVFVFWSECEVNVYG